MSDNPYLPNLVLPTRTQSQYDSAMEARVAVLEQIAKNTEKVLDRMDMRLDRMDSRMERMEDRMERIEDRQRADFKWLLGMGMGGTGFLVAVMAHGFNWY